MSRAIATAEAIAAQARQLKMPGLAKGFVALARQAREEKWSIEDYLHEVLAIEIASRVESAIRQRIHNAQPSGAGVR
jgi:DNA replication protein DnaC